MPRSGDLLEAGSGLESFAEPRHRQSRPSLHRKDLGAGLHELTRGDGGSHPGLA
jgi:hypothetical protein